MSFSVKNFLIDTIISINNDNNEKLLISPCSDAFMCAACDDVT